MTKQELRNNAPIIPGAEVKETFAELFDEDGNVLPAEQSPIATHIIHNTNQQAGVELNLFFKSPEGFKSHIKLHGEDGTDLLDHGQRVLNWLTGKGWTPEYAPAPPNAQPTREDLPADGSASELWCEIHKAKMKRKENKHGVWYSHQTDDPAYADKDGWCNGKPKS